MQFQNRKQHLLHRFAFSNRFDNPNHLTSSMRNFSEPLIMELDEQLNIIHSSSNDPMVYALKSVQILVIALEKLKTYFLKYKFLNKQEEIEFFRETKPQLASRLIYYNEIYNIAGNKPLGAKRAIRKYYTVQLTKLNSYLEKNAEFCKYYRTGSHYLDKKYFIRGKYDVRLTLDSFYLQADKRFSTSHDYTVSRILASDLLSQYITKEIDLLVSPKPLPQISKKLKWTGSKVALVELIYALHTQAIINGGNASLTEIILYFEQMFDVDLGQFNRTFVEIRDRRIDRTKFLTALTNTLLLRMDDADEN